MGGISPRVMVGAVKTFRHPLIAVNWATERAGITKMMTDSLTFKWLSIRMSRLCPVLAIESTSHGQDKSHHPGAQLQSSS